MVCVGGGGRERERGEREVRERERERERKREREREKYKMREIAFMKKRELKILQLHKCCEDCRAVVEFDCEIMMEKWDRMQEV